MRRKCNSTQVILLILVAVFTILNPNFLSPFNLYNFLMQNEYRIVMITGLAIIMLGGEIDRKGQTTRLSLKPFLVHT